jgi:dephospho-CoA kinase
MFRVALTGNIASGKSAVASEWARLGAAIVDADELARRAVEPGAPALDRVREEFGAGVILPNGTLDRVALRRIVFSDPVRRRVLEQILHPEIARLRDADEAALESEGVTIVVHVIPLLFEAGLQDEFDAVVLVDAPEPTRLIRLTDTRGLTAKEAAGMIDAQQPVARKRALLEARRDDQFTLVIENDKTLAQLEKRAREAWQEIEKVALQQP